MDEILPNLGMELPDIGSDQDTWGDILNANLRILDNAVTYDAITKTLGAVDVTLTTAEAAHGVINLDGTLTANVNLIVPVSPVRLYLVNNGTTGAFTVTVKTPLGTGITVLQGANSLVYSNGTDIVQGATSVSGSFAAGTANVGTLNVSGDATVTGGLSSGATTFITAGNKIAVFGTGSVFSANPASLGALDNVAIGATTPSTGAFTTLSASGATTLNGAVTLGDASGDAITVTGTATFAQATQFPDGTAALPSITNTGDTNTGVYFPAADTVAVSNGGTESLRIDSARNMGLGVTPSAWQSGVRALQFGTRGAVSQSVSGSAILSNNYYVDSAGTARYLTSSFAGLYAIQGNGEQTFQVAPSGTAGNPITFTQAMTLTNGGNLLVGATVDRGAKLYLNNDISVTAADANKILLFGTNVTTSADAYGFGVSPSQLNYKCGNGANHVFHVSTSERARITSGGYFKASNTGSYGGVAGLADNVAAGNHIVQSNNSSATLISLNADLSANTRNYDSYLATGAAGFHYMGRVNAVITYQVLANGNVQNTNNSYGAISDQKLKENVTDASSYLDRFMQVRFRNFNFIGSDLKQFGVIAQELEQVFPGLVDTTPDFKEVTKTRTVLVPAVEEVRDEEGNVVTEAQPATTREEEYTESVPTGEVTKSVKYSVLALMAGKVIQEQQEIIKAQQATIDAQQATITAQQAQIDAIMARLDAMEAK